MFSKNPKTGYYRIPRYRIIHDQKGNYSIWDDLKKEAVFSQYSKETCEELFKQYKLGKVYK